jgi:PAS domain S-box-containing protein
MRQGLDRRWIEPLLDLMPDPVVLIETGTADVIYANAAALELTGGVVRGVDSPEFAAHHCTDERGERIPLGEMPRVRAGRGERLRNVTMDWHTDGEVRSLVVNSDVLPPLGDEPAIAVLRFEDVSELRTATRMRDESFALLDSMFESTPLGLAYLDGDLRYARVNDKLAEIDGVPAADHIGRTPAEVLGEHDPGVEAMARQVLDSGEPIIDAEVDSAVASADGLSRRFSTSFFPVSQNGRVVGVGGIIVDVSERHDTEMERSRALADAQAARAEAEEAARRAHFLAEASVILDESLDYASTLASIARLAVPWLADWCAVDMVGADGERERVAIAHVDPEKIALVEEMERRYPQDPDAATGPPNVLRTGRSEIYPDITDEMIVQAARDEEHLEFVRSLEMRGVIIVPMVARGRTLGTITLAAAETGRRFGEEDLLLAEELARRAGQSVDNARLYRERSHVARTLQESLLPPELPDIPGLELAARYRAAGEGNQVGGDFYDLFQLPDGGWAVVMGDVCGKGPEAAALTALVRYTLRAMAPGGGPPSSVLRQLNDAILRQRSDGRFCTVAFAIVTSSREGVRLELASGGHPLPLVLRAEGSAVEPVGEPGTLLGIVHDPELHDVTVDLASGDTLVLYTDGVTEAGAPDHMMGAGELAAILVGCESAGPSAVAECLERAAVDAGGGQPQDDIAIVVARVADPMEALPAGAPGATHAAG